MKEETRLEYLKLANHFIKTVQEKHETDKVSPSTYIQELELRAYSTTPAYWRRLRNALNTYAIENLSGRYRYAYKTLENPVTKNGLKNIPSDIKAKISKRKKANSMSEKEFNKIKDSANDESTKAVMDIVSITGCRPAEIPTIKINKDGTLTIESAKKDEADSRGLDRTIKIDDMEKYSSVVNGLLTIKAEAKASAISESKLMDRVKDRFSYAAKRAYPKRKGICLYTLRHQVGAELKASGMERKEIAYLMGHRVTASVDVYGNSSSKNARRGGACMRAADRSELAQVKENHKSPEMAHAASKTLGKSNTRSASFDY